MADMYKQSGVNLDEADNLNKKLAKNVFDKNSNAFVGEVPVMGMKILNCCDGIGSKIIPLYNRKMYKEIAIDLVAANLNDMATKNAKAVSFSDYIAVNKLDSEAVSHIVKELKFELEKYGCELVGGETSEIPHLLRDGTIDICGFAIGIADMTKTFDICSNDIVIGLKSSGIHANGFTLIRKLYADNKLSENEFITCLTPAFVYYKAIRILWDNGLIKAGANITGGGIYDNLVRVIPEDLKVNLNYDNIPSQTIYKKLNEIIKDEMWKVFNCGVGFCVVTSKENKEAVFNLCSEFSPFILGEVVKK